MGLLWLKNRRQYFDVNRRQYFGTLNTYFADPIKLLKSLNFTFKKALGDRGLKKKKYTTFLKGSDSHYH